MASTAVDGFTGRLPRDGHSSLPSLVLDLAKLTFLSAEHRNESASLSFPACRRQTDTITDRLTNYISPLTHWSATAQVTCSLHASRCVCLLECAFLHRVMVVLLCTPSLQNQEAKRKCMGDGIWNLVTEFPSPKCESLEVAAVYILLGLISGCKCFVRLLQDITSKAYMNGAGQNTSEGQEALGVYWPSKGQWRLTGEAETVTSLFHPCWACPSFDLTGHTGYFFFFRDAKENVSWGKVWE